MMTSMTLAASMTLAQIPFAELSTTAGAVETGVTSYSRNDIATKVFGITKSGGERACNCWHVAKYGNSFSSTGGPNGSTVSGYYAHNFIVIDPRITGTITIESAKDTFSNVSSCGKMSEPSNFGDNIHMYNGYNATKGGTQYSSYKNINIAYTITYTPSAEDIANHVALMENGNFSDPIVYAAGAFQTGSVNAQYYKTLEAGVPISVTYENTSVGLCLGDIVTYMENGCKWVSDPISSFSSTSVNKTYLDADFSAGFTTDSDGAVTYSSSNTNVATIATNGTISIKSAGTTTITAKTAATSAYNESTTSMTLTVGKATPSLSNIKASKNLAYLQTLSKITVSGTAKVGSKTVAGTWS